MPLLIALILLIIGFSALFFTEIRYQFNQHMARELSMIATNHHSSMILRGEKLSAVAETLSQDPGLIQALAAGDRDVLLTLGQPVFEHLKNNFNITHFYFHDAHRRTLLRLHNTGVYGDRNERISAQLAEQKGQTAVGIGLGKTGTYTQRAVTPVKSNGRLMGYLELGEETLDNLLDLAHDFKLQGFVLLYKDFLDRTDWEQFMRNLNREPDWERYPDRVLAAQTDAQVAGILTSSLLSGWNGLDSPQSQLMKIGERMLNVGAIPLRDAGNRQIGQLIVLRDITFVTDRLHRKLLRFDIHALSGGLTILLFIYFHLRNTELELRGAHQRIIDDSNAHEAEQRRHIEELTGRIEDLERFERLTVRRELRIQTLKQENRKLKSLINADLMEE